MTLERTKVETTALHAVVQKARAMLALRTPLESVGPTDIHLMDQLLAIQEDIEKGNIPDLEVRTKPNPNYRPRD